MRAYSWRTDSDCVSLRNHWVIKSAGNLDDHGENSTFIATMYLHWAFVRLKSLHWTRPTFALRIRLGRCEQLDADINNYRILCAYDDVRECVR
ncbi:hypothetical protein EV650_7690 [Kribbella kalugense]|uniref:Uncharacterized protein n=1 Tax=Kribbella kalugense TaxID=2512221 RepID=A0A4R7Z9H2_9ACTN|nr:hypothetical protein EV650_7690 [Kribbella kalugense]